jgi:signal transduction histidine kinase
MSLDLFELLKSYCRLDATDSAALAELLPRVRPAFPRIIDEFYLRILEYEGTRRVIQSPEQLERLKASLLRWLGEVFRGPYDAAYYEKRRLIGIAHVRVGLSQVYVFGAMSHIRRQLETAILSDTDVPLEARRVGCDALAKVLDIDLALIAGSYHEKALVEQASLARLGEMAAVVAHEVKNPLAGIGGALQVIAEQLPRGGSGRDMVEEILERLDALNDTVNDLLLFARPRLPSKEPVPVLSLIEDTIALMRSDPSYKNVAFRVSGQDVVVQAEAELLKPALMNVLINAAQAVGSAGQVVVEVASSNGTCSIFVQDNGPGILPELREKVFEPFFSTKHRGTGLGLPITKRIIEVHGGEISMTFPSSGGTAVSIRLPVLQVGG